MRNLNLAWIVSLLVIGITSLIAALSHLMEKYLTDWAIKLIGVVDLICLPMLIITAMRKWKKRS